MRTKVIDELNQLLADSKVFYQNLHNFHWNIRGENFFPLHCKLGELYDVIGDDTDEYAERVLALGGTPLSTYTAYIQTSGIKEEQAVSSDKYIINSVLKSLQSSIKQLNKVKQAAVERDDEGTIAIIGPKLICAQKQLWQFSAFLGKTTPTQ